MPKRQNPTKLAGRRGLRMVASVAVAAILTGVSAEAATTLRGRVKMTAPGGRPAPRGSDPALAVVSFTPDGGSLRPPTAKIFVMSTRGKEFQPKVLAVPRGSMVRFPNFDPILHNVFSVSGRSRFDLGLYGRSDGRSHRFDHSGVVRVYCNVHHSMVGYIVVVDTPYFAAVAADGSFRIDQVPATKGELALWHPQGKAPAVELPAGQTVATLELEITRRRVPAHLNKFGKSYRNRRNRYGG